jgi:GDPmannose 4,6-dehydratase
MKNAIIFGITGQDGFYLNNLLQQKNIEVIGVARKSENWIKGDVANYQEVESLIKQLQPNYVFHFAANSTTRHEALFENHQSILTGSLNILEACYKHSKQTRIFLSGSAVQFQNNGNPIDETTPFAPLSPYAVSRIASVYAGRYYHGLGLKVYTGYFFNHDSPLRTERHVNQKIIAAVKRIVNGSDEIIEIGDISTKKEFNFAGDVVEAVWKLVNQESIFETVIGSGKAYTIEDWIKICFEKAKLDWQKYIIEKKDFVSEYTTLVSDPKLIMSLGWSPKVSIQELATMMYQH